VDERPYTVLSCAMSIDGYIASAARKPLPLSNAADFDRVDAVRATCDAILVGAATVRSDQPRLLLRSPARRNERLDRGAPPSPIKVTVTGGGRLDASATFFAAGDTEKVVYCTTAGVHEASERLGSVATVVNGGQQVSMHWMSEDLYRRGVRRLMVEGGQSIHTQFLTGDLADELHLAVAPFFVGDSAARRFVSDGRFPWHPDRRATLAEVRQLGDVALLRYALSQRFRAEPLEEV
jgi:5-amino-6-(5-phosphoribosylamino)uracil reductase